MKTQAHKVAQVLRIARRIEHMTKTKPNEGRRAARYFAFWLSVINHKPVFQTKSLN